jgi:hypothetical protein
VSASEDWYLFPSSARLTLARSKALRRRDGVQQHSAWPLAMALQMAASGRVGNDRVDIAVARGKIDCASIDKVLAIGTSIG